MNGRTVLLFGRSLLLAGVAASLEQCPDLHVVHALAWQDLIRLPQEIVPDAVIFELGDVQERHILPILLRNPALIMLGLDPECNQAVLLTGQEARSLSVAHIKEMIGVADQAASGENPWPDNEQ
jgi:hypothetical protein